MSMTKKRKKAVALRYNPLKDRAPKITAKGSGDVAERIIEIAHKHNIPVKDDADLVEVLSKLEIEKEIPPDVYVVVAELLSFVYSVNGKKTLF
ncbi:MAG: EscU/YscU/HrcU family type III secretion system export apparatus switch protein [Proteobacteria bacterium]|nr:EscU/YscU/HrcU family type III secretion system export apparatus switch protein [Pseudomonadota bacterium]